MNQIGTEECAAACAKAGYSLFLDSIRWESLSVNKFCVISGDTLREPFSYVGIEWLVEAVGCQPHLLRDIAALRALIDRVIGELDLHVVGEPLWKQFPPPGGITGLYLLTESHLACHTYPEYQVATFNLYCCRPRAQWPWAERLAEMLGASRVLVRTLHRGQEEL